MIELIVQLDYKLEDLDKTMKETINHPNPSNKSKNPISIMNNAVTPNPVNRNMLNASISVDSPNQKPRYRHLKKVPRVFTVDEKTQQGYKEIHQFYAR